MTSEDLVATPRPSQPAGWQPHSTAHESRQRRWWLLGLVACSAIAVVAAAAAFLPDVTSTRAVVPALTHTIARGDLLVAVTEQGTLESSHNTEIKCQVRGDNTIIWVIKSGTEVQPGDELVRLETRLIEEEISERTKFAHLARSQVERSRADVARAELAIAEYLEGRYGASLATLQKDRAIAESRLLSAKNERNYAKMMSGNGYVNKLEVEEKEFAVAQWGLTLDHMETQIDVLQRFTKAEELATLTGNLKAAKAKLEADKETALADEQRLKRAEEELGYCVIKAERRGLVIYATAQAWEEAPKIEEGATVHKDQVLLLMPDVTRMQVKVGIHESVIDRIEPGLPARVTLPDKTLDGKVAAVSPVTRPAGWWTGNVVKYDTIVELPPMEGLKPGMSVKVEVLLAHHEQVLTIPTSAVLESRQGHACWVQTPQGVERRALQLGDHSDMSIVVEAGVTEGERVVLDPLADVEEAQTEAAMTLQETPATPTDKTQASSPGPQERS
jgi:HlyD family secretion protein